MPDALKTATPTRGPFRGEELLEVNELEVFPGIFIRAGLCSGAPCVKGRRIATEWLLGRFLAAESVASLAEDYEMEAQLIEQAIRYEFKLRRARQKRPRAVASLSRMELEGLL